METFDDGDNDDDDVNEIYRRDSVQNVISNFNNVVTDDVNKFGRSEDMFMEYIYQPTTSYQSENISPDRVYSDRRSRGRPRKYSNEIYHDCSAHDVISHGTNYGADYNINKLELTQSDFFSEYIYQPSTSYFSEDVDPDGWFFLEKKARGRPRKYPKICDSIKRKTGRLKEDQKSRKRMSVENPVVEVRDEELEDLTNIALELIKRKRSKDK